MEHIQKLTAQFSLTREEAKKLLSSMIDGTLNGSQIAAVLGIYLTRLPTLDELAGFQEAMLSFAIEVDLSAYDPIDLCGTGGDGKNTFNISTLAAFIVAACGVPVAKHGNYGASSISGSSNVLEAIGVKLHTDVDSLKRDLDKCGICFLHAPYYHPAMKAVAPIRKELGVKTFFNLLGPLVSPVQPKKQLIGLPNAALLRLYTYFLQGGKKQFSLVSSRDGYDEISLTDSWRWVTEDSDRGCEPEEYGFIRVNPNEIEAGDTIDSAAKIFIKILKGEGAVAQNQVVVANAAVALCTAKQTLTFVGAKEMAIEGLKSGKAFNVLEKLRNNADS